MISPVFKKILILGNGGSGKSSLAKKLSTYFSYPVLHLDKVYWSQAWEKTDAAVFQETVYQWMKQDHWIIEGTPMLGLDERLAQADTVIFLDASRIKCLYRILKRRLRIAFFKNETSDGCPRVIDLKLIDWILKFPNEKQELILNKIRDAQPCHFFHVKNDKTLQELLLRP